MSSLHSRYEFSQFGNIAEELRAKLLELCHEAKKYNISLCIDAEESERLEMSLVLFEQMRLDDSHIGSNIGNRLFHLQRATELLKKRYLKDLKSSIILETKAILPNGAPPDWNKPFLNMIVYGSCSSSPEKLLKGLKQIECDIGRPQVYKKWAPRVIDLDILLWDDLTFDTPDLKIPHPELVNRPFLLHLMAMVNKTFAFNVQECFSKSFTISPKLMGIVNQELSQDLTCVKFLRFSHFFGCFLHL